MTSIFYNTHHRDANMVLMGEGRNFKYEFDWSSAKIPALAAVSPNLDTGPIQLKLDHISDRDGIDLVNLP